jgi:hypothetical protein
MEKAIVIAGDNARAPFSLKARRGEGMALLSMDWTDGQPPDDFVGFAIEVETPGKPGFKPLKNRLSFPDAAGNVAERQTSSLEAPFQLFRWTHFPYDPEVAGEFVYRVSPVSMAADGSLSYGEPQKAAVTLGGDTYAGALNVAFTRGFVSSQAFVDRYAPIETLLPESAAEGLTFEPTNPKATKAYEWMGFEARRAILGALEQAEEDETAQVRVIAYELNEPEVVERLEKLGTRLRVIIDNSRDHAGLDTAESAAERRLKVSAGAANVTRQRLANLQHNKTIVVESATTQLVVCGSTNFSWRGFFVQNNNALVLHGPKAVAVFGAAFEQYWQHGKGAAGFSATPPAELNDLGIPDVAAEVAFSPHAGDNALLEQIAEDIKSAKSSVFYSLAFLAQTKGPIRDAITAVTEDARIFVYGIADKRVEGIKVQTPDGNVEPVSPAELTQAPPPFKDEPSGLGPKGEGIRMHHKFVVIDFDKPTARVYTGSYNFSKPADLENGENLLVIRDPRVACSYTIEALVMFDHYSFRIARRKAANKKKPLALQRPPSKPQDTAWWERFWSEPHKARDRKVFA